MYMMFKLEFLKSAWRSIYLTVHNLTILYFSPKDPIPSIRDGEIQDIFGTVFKIYRRIWSDFK